MPAVPTLAPGEKRTRKRTPRPTARTVVGTILDHSAQALTAALVTLQAGITPDGVHDARVTIRRAQSALDLGTKVFAAGSVDELRAELTWMMRALGDVRDLDVLIPRLQQLTDDAELIAAFEHDRDEARFRLEAILVSGRVDRLTAMLREAALRPTTVPQADDDAIHRLRPIVRRRWHMLEHAVDRLGKHPTARQLHHVRILAKRCRYTCEVCSEALGSPARRMARRLRAVQDELGSLQDTAVLVRRLRELGDRRPDLAFDAGRVAGIAEITQSTDQRSWRRAWKRVDRHEVLAWL